MSRNGERSSGDVALPGRKDPPEKIADVLRDLIMMGLEGEMPCVEQVDLGIGQILLVGERSSWNEGRVMPAPDGEERGLVLPEVSLELRVQRNIRTIVQNEVELHLLRARSRVMVAADWAMSRNVWRPL